jgi:hypothetical protein
MCSVPGPIEPGILLSKSSDGYVGFVSARCEPEFVRWTLRPRKHSSPGGVRWWWTALVWRRPAREGSLLFPWWGRARVCGCGLCGWQMRGLRPVLKENSLWRVVWSRCLQPEGMVCRGESPSLVPSGFFIGERSSNRTHVARRGSSNVIASE